MRAKKTYLQILLIVVLIIICTASVHAAPGISISDDGITIGSSDNPQEVSESIKILLLLTILSIAPSILIMMTSFTRIIIVLSFLRNAMGTQQMPPNQVMIGLALFLTFFIMKPVITDINDNAFKPFSNNEITMEVALERSSNTIKGFMLDRTRSEDLGLFLDLDGVSTPVDEKDISLTVAIPSFLISELRKAFTMGFIIFIPFLVIDMVVASTLMSMGMMMLPPVMISLPFKILLFIVVDGWNLVASVIVDSFVVR